MNQTANTAVACRSVFQQDAETTTTENYTQVWIRLINQLEKKKRVPAGAQ